MSENQHKELVNNIIKANNMYMQAWSDLLEKNKDSIEYNLAHMQKELNVIYNKVIADPLMLWQHTLELYQDYIALWKNSINSADNDVPHERSNVFRAEEWHSHPVYKFYKHLYRINSDWVLSLARKISETDSPKNAKRTEFFTKLIVDAMAPTNIPWINPRVVKETLETSGMNLIKGAANFLKDSNMVKDGYFGITITDFDKFTFGENIAATPGNVVYKNELIELINYSPAAKTVYEVPLLMVPAWINKYYIFDLSQERSFVHWLVEKGYNVFIISWINPTSKHAKVDFEDYMQDGILAALDYVKENLKVNKVNCLGYCLGGTLLAITAAFLAKQNNHSIKTASFLTTLLDFEDSGDIGLLIDDEAIGHIEDRMSEKGYLDGNAMAQTFNMLRANDMIWSYYVDNYFMGKTPKAFDILYWNSDPTRLPMKMHSYYLRNMYQNNLLIQPNKLKMLNVPIDLGLIKIPTYTLATSKDHIAPWGSVLKSHNAFRGKKQFVLADSGHVAGVINPPEQKKYCYWVNDNNVQDPAQWRVSAKKHNYSWWDHWHKWMKPAAGERIAVTKLPSLTALYKAPGAYVLTK